MLLGSANFWILLATVIFIAVVFKKVRAYLVAHLDSRSERIKRDLEEAKRLREEAQATLADYERRQRDAMYEAEQIVQRARDTAQRMRAQAEESMEASIKRREQQARDQIAQAEANAVQEVRSQAVDVAMAATRSVLQENLSAQQHQRLVDDAVADLPKRLQ